MEHKYVLFSGIVISSLLATTFALTSNGNKLVAQGDITWFGVDIEAFISIATCILAFFLFSLSFIAYRKDRREKLLFITTAFFLYAVKGFLIAVEEIISLEVFPLEAIAQLLDFGVLALFFLGLMKK